MPDLYNLVPWYEGDISGYDGRQKLQTIAHGIRIAMPAIVI